LLPPNEHLFLPFQTGDLLVQSLALPKDRLEGPQSLASQVIQSRQEVVASQVLPLGKLPAHLLRLELEPALRRLYLYDPSLYSR
jgi:hypothetical protein